MTTSPLSFTDEPSTPSMDCSLVVFVVAVAWRVVCCAAGLLACEVSRGM